MGHPVAALVGQVLLTALTAGFTAGDSPIRLLGLIPMVLAVPYYVQHASSIPNLFQANFGGAQAVLALYQYLDVVFINKWDVRFHGPLPRASEREVVKENGNGHGAKPIRENLNVTLWRRLCFGLYAAASFRKSGTPFETHGVRPFRRDAPAYVPPAWEYSISAAFWFVVYYLALDGLTSLGTADDLAKLFAEEKQPLFSRMHEMEPTDYAERVVTAVMFWTVLFLVLSTFICFVSFVLVATGWSSVSWWKPPFNLVYGPPYTIRRFWSHFWHKIVTDRIHQPSLYICDQLLRLPRGSLLRRYGTLALTFLFSAAFHTVADIAGGIPASKTGAPYFFFVQVLAIVFEDAVQFVWRTCFPGSSSSQPGAWQKAVGRIWVFLFFVWSTPFFAYPMNLNNGDGLIVPFSVMRWIMGRSQ